MTAGLVLGLGVRVSFRVRYGNPGIDRSRPAIAAVLTQLMFLYSHHHNPVKLTSKNSAWGSSVAF